MSRSRRRTKPGKCTCGRDLVRFDGEYRRGRPVSACPVVDYPHEFNEQRARYLRAKDNRRGYD